MLVAAYFLPLFLVVAIGKGQLQNRHPKARQPSSSLLGVCSLILFALFATGVNDTGGKFAAGVVDTGVVDTGGNLPPVSLTPVANLPPMSTTQGELVAKFAASVVDTGGKFAAGVVDTGGNLPPVSLTPVVHLDLRISPRILGKNSKLS